MAWQCPLTAQKATCILGYTTRGVASRQGRDSEPSTSLEVLHPAVGLPRWDGCGPAGASPEKVTQMLRGMEHYSFEEMLKELWLFSPGEGSKQTLQYLPVPEGGLEESCRGTFYKDK